MKRVNKPLIISISGVLLILIIIGCFINTSTRGQNNTTKGGQNPSTVPIQEVTGKSREPSNDNDLTQLSIEWKCLNGDDLSIRMGNNIKFGAFFHYEHQDSVRRRSWQRIAEGDRRENSYWLKTVGVNLVPYVTDIGDGERKKYMLVPTGFSDQEFTAQDVYRFACTADEIQQMRDHPNWYPTVFLTPKERKDQDILQQYLQNLPQTIDAHKFIPQEIDFPGTRPLGSYLKEIFSRAKEQKDVVFLRDWQHGVVTIKPLGFGNDQTMVFEYEPHEPPTGKPMPDQSPPPTQQPEQESEQEPGPPLVQQPTPEPTLEPAPEPVQDIINVRINFPSELKGIEDLKNHVKLTGCASVNSSEDGWSHVITMCPRENLPQVISIDGFKAIPISKTPDDEGILTIEIQPTQMMAQFKVVLAKESDVRYVVGEQYFTPGEPSTLNIPITQIREPVMFIARDHQKPDLPISKCDFGLETLSIAQAIRGDPIELPSYKINTITWPKNWNTPIFRKDSGNLISIGTTVDKGITWWWCARSLDRNITLSWGPGWEDISFSANELNTRRNYEVGLSRFMPKLPLQIDDPWLREDTSSDTTHDPCEELPGYRPRYAMLTYCKNNNECLEELPIEITRKDEGYQVLNLKDGGWSEKEPLPNVASIVLEKISPNPTYKPLLKIPQWPLDQPVKPRKLQEMEVDPEEKFPIAFEGGNVDYDVHTKLMLFDSQNACETADVSTYRSFTPFIQYNIENLQTNECKWALLVRNDRKITECTRGERKEDTIVYTMSKNQFEGKRWVFVIESSETLGRYGRGEAIQEALISWLQDLKRTRKAIRLNLFVIRSDKEPKEVLRGEDLGKLAFSSDDDTTPSIVRTIRTNVEFSDTGFQTLINTGLIDREIPAKEVERVLYFTDSQDLPDDPDKIHNDQLGALFGWQINEIPVMIVTDTEQDCSKWPSELKVECAPLSTNLRPDDVRRSIFDKWLQ